MTPAQQPTPKRAAIGCGAILAVAAIIGIAVAVASSSDDAPDDQMAAVMCEEFVKERLKSPGSADFSGVNDTSIKALSDATPWQYEVTGHVDSDNSFGASVRNTYVCTISTEDNDNWTLDNLDLTER